MPQDGRRSGRYRSFVKCDDPKGVADCGAIKIPKADLQKMKNKVEAQKNPRNLLASSSCREGRAVDGGKLSNSSSFRLSEVSKGADKLNDTIQSWSKRSSFDVGSKDIATDLLRGALDLQESLMMLGKLQKASEYMSKLKRKQKAKAESESVDDGVRRTASFQFRGSEDHIGFQRPRLSADGCSRNSYEEIRKVIKDSLARQNLLPYADTEEESYFALGKLESSSEVASTTSRSSLACSNDFGSTDCSVSSLDPPPQKKAGEPNLIAKLMGLEDMPSKLFRTATRKPLEAGKIAYQKKPLFDVDMPKARKPQHVDHKTELEPRTLADKGGLKCQSHCSTTVHSEQMLVDDKPPIVIMKPLSLRHLQSKEVVAPRVIMEEEYLAAKEVLRKLKSAKNFPAEAAGCNSMALNLDIKHVIMGQENRDRSLGEEDGIEECKEVIVNSEDDELKSKERNYSYKPRHSAPVNSKPKKKEVVELELSKDQKAALVSRNKVRKDLRPKILSKIKDPTKASAKTLGNPEIKSTNSEYPLYKCRSTTLHATSCATQTEPHDLTDQNDRWLKDQWSSRKAPVANAVVENLHCSTNANIIDIPCEIESVPIAYTTSAANHQAEEPTDAFEVQIDKHANGVTAPTTQHEERIKSIKDATDFISHRAEERRNSSTRDSTKALLFSSPSFINHAEELFDIDLNQLISLQAYEIKEFAPRLTLDCSKEIMERKSFVHSQRLHPQSRSCTRSTRRTSISLDRLVDEVCDGLEDLRSYSYLANGNLAFSSLNVMLERDMWSKGLASSMWDFGWRNGFSLDDVELIVRDTEKLLLTNLIEELHIDSFP